MSSIKQVQPWFGSTNVSHIPCPTTWPFWHWVYMMFVSFFILFLLHLWIQDASEKVQFTFTVTRSFSLYRFPSRPHAFWALGCKMFDWVSCGLPQVFILLTWDRRLKHFFILWLQLLLPVWRRCASYSLRCDSHSSSFLPFFIFLSRITKRKLKWRPDYGFILEGVLNFASQLITLIRILIFWLVLVCFIDSRSSRLSYKDLPNFE